MKGNHPESIPTHVRLYLHPRKRVHDVLGAETSSCSRSARTVIPLTRALSVRSCKAVGSKLLPASSASRDRSLTRRGGRDRHRFSELKELTSFVIRRRRERRRHFYAFPLDATATEHDLDDQESALLRTELESRGVEITTAEDVDGQVLETREDRPSTDDEVDLRVEADLTGVTDSVTLFDERD